MKWKRSKKAQQEAKAKAAAERAAKANGLPLPKSENKSKRITEEDEALSSDHEDEDIDVGAEDSDTGTGPTLVAPTPILGHPQLQLRPPMIRPPNDSETTNLSALLPAHLARLSQAASAATGGNRLYRPFVAWASNV